VAWRQANVAAAAAPKRNASAYSLVAWFVDTAAFRLA